MVDLNYHLNARLRNVETWRACAVRQLFHLASQCTEGFGLWKPGY